MQEEGKNSRSDKKTLLNNYAKYSTVGFQMFAIIGAFTYVGYKIDEKREAATPLATALLSLIGVLIALYVVIRTLRKIKS